MEGSPQGKSYEYLCLEPIFISLIINVVMYPYIFSPTNCLGFTSFVISQTSKEKSLKAKDNKYPSRVNLIDLIAHLEWQMKRYYNVY